MSHLNLTLSSVILLVFLLVLIEGFFSGSEIALLSADKLLLQQQAKEGNKKSSLALKLATRPEKVLSTTLLMTSLCVIGASSIISIFLLNRWEKHGELLAVLITSPIIVIFGELIPKILYQKHSTLLARWVAPPVFFTYSLFFPITRLLSLYTSRLSRMVGPLESLVSGKTSSTRERIRALLAFPRKETELKPSEKKMIQRILDFRNTEARRAHIPLVKVDAIDVGSSVREALKQFQSNHHSRMPVFSERIDNITGILEFSDLLSLSDLDQPIQNHMTPARYVAGSHSLEDLMLMMRRENKQMVIVVDEHGGAIGILTFEDIVEEIVGEIQDEYDSEATPYKEVSTSKWLIQARMEMIQINEVLGLELPLGDYETLGGFLLKQFGRIPEVNDELIFDTRKGSFKFVVHKANERQIQSVLIQKLE